MAGLARLVSLIAAAFFAASITSASEPERIAIVDINVVTMINDSFLPKQVVLVSDRKIEAIVPFDEAEIPDGYRVIDGMGRFLVPGLADMHVHFRQANEMTFSNYLSAGITLVRDMDGRPQQLEWRDEINAGLRLGPRMFVASPTMANRRSPFEGYPTPETPQEAKQVVAAFAEEGYDLIKVYSYLPREIFFAVLEEANSRGLKVAGHIPLAVGLEDAIDAGFESNEHLSGYFDIVADEGTLALDREDYRGILFAGEIDRASLDRIVSKTVESGMWNAPSVMWFTKRNANRRARTAYSDPELRWQGHENRIEVVRALHEAGAKIMLGTDSDDGQDLPATSIYEELQLMVDAGMTPYEALRTSTTNPSIYLGLEDSGTIAEGNRADLLILSCNPLEHIRCVQYLDEVFAHGRQYFRPQARR